MSSEYYSRVERQVRRLGKRSLLDIERETAQKRTRWIKTHKHLVPPAGQVTPRQAFELLFFTYMKLAPNDLEIVSEGADHISWMSHKPCPTLDACEQLGLDTRTVCRQAFEKSTQAFFSAIDPQLRFWRSYERIRPYSDACLEEIRWVDFDGIMRIAIDEANTSRSVGNKGYGAVVVSEARILTKAHDTAAVMNDPSLHAEVNAIKAAIVETGKADLCGSILFSTCEPCPMCSSLAVWANITTICFGVSIEKTARLGKIRIQVPAQEIVERSPAMIEVIPGILEEECLNLYQ